MVERQGDAREGVGELGRVGRLYVRLFDRLFARPVLVLAATLAVATGSACLVPRIGLDMSFRPLFGQSRQGLEATRAFEERFGQRSGAHIGAVVTPAAWTPEVLESIAAATREVEGLAHVSEVTSVARFPTVRWTPDGPEVGWLVEPAVLDSVSDAELAAVLGLRGDPALVRTLFSGDGRRTLLMARLDLPLEDLEGRAPVIRAFQAAVGERLERHADLHWVGISVVEVAYARMVLDGIALSLVLTTLALSVGLGVVYRRPAAVMVVMAGVGLALPVALAAMVVRGQAVTIVNSMVPTMIMVIGVADAIHMFECWAGQVRRGTRGRSAVRAMFGDMAVPCALTTLTTVAGFLALETARIAAIRDFGLNTAVGITAVYAANLLVLPALLLVLPEPWLMTRRKGRSWLGGWQRATTGLVTGHPRVVAGAALVMLGACAAGVHRLDVDQRFNEDVPSDHPVRASQALFEQEFTGLLGPDVWVRRLDGASVVGPGGRRRIADFARSLRSLPGVLHVASVVDYVPEGPGDAEVASGLALLDADHRARAGVRDVITPDGSETVVALGLRDIGSRAALDLVDEIRRAADRDLGPDYEATVVGQWWLAQLGLSNILRDMLVSFGTSFALVIPLLAVALRSVRLFLVGLIPNLLPTFFVLGFMGWMGISARVGTAMILAIALAIAVDDTIHMLVRLKEARRRSGDPAEHVRAAIDEAGGPVLLTTVVLVAGFLSMRANGLLALQDMGLVAAAALTVALLADVYLLPASYLLLERRTRRTYVEDPSALRGLAYPPPLHRGPSSGHTNPKTTPTNPKDAEEPWEPDSSPRSPRTARRPARS